MVYYSNSTTFCLQTLQYLGQVFDGKVWSLRSRRILSDIDTPLPQRQPHPNWLRALEFAPYSPHLACMDYCVWPLIEAKVQILLAVILQYGAIRTINF